MGYISTRNGSRMDIINKRIKGWDSEISCSKCLKHVLRGNCLWSIWEIFIRATGETKKIIGLDILSKDPGYGWGYKSMEESAGPYHHSCPLAWLDEVPIPDSEHAPKWRERVRAYHEQSGRGRTVRVGNKYVLKNTRDLNGKVVTVVKAKPLSVDIEGAGIFRLKRVCLGEQLLA